MAILLNAIAAGILVSSAAEAAPAGNATVQKSAKTGQADAKNAQKYCIAYDKITGSRVTEQECKTREQWAKQGIDVDKPSS